MGSGNTKSNMKEVSVGVEPPDFGNCGFYWERGNLIGEGGFGRVYECLNVDTGELLATKFIQVDPCSAEMQAISQEIQLLKRLSHPNIVKYIATCASEQGIDIIMEFVSGGSVRNLLNKFYRLHEKTVQLYVRQLLAGLVFLHKQGVVHRDIKCANLLLGPQGTIKISDFGSSAEILKVSGKEFKYSLKGTPYWMAPEVVRRNGHAFAADIWSVGCVVIEMLTGSPPWIQKVKRIKQLFDILENLTTLPPIPENISDACENFLMNCFVLDPAARPTAEELLNHPFLTDEIQIHEEDLYEVEEVPEGEVELRSSDYMHHAFRTDVPSVKAFALKPTESIPKILLESGYFIQHLN